MISIAHYLNSLKSNEVQNLDAQAKLDLTDNVNPKLFMQWHEEHEVDDRVCKRDPRHTIPHGAIFCPKCPSVLEYVN